MGRSARPVSRYGGGRKTGSAFTEPIPRNFKPARDRSVPTKDAVDCPDCPAVAGGRCLRADGTETEHCHRARRRMALRKERGE